MEKERENIGKTGKWRKRMSSVVQPRGDLYQ